MQMFNADKNMVVYFYARAAYCSFSYQKILILHSVNNNIKKLFQLNKWCNFFMIVEFSTWYIFSLIIHLVLFLCDFWIWKKSAGTKYPQVKSLVTKSHTKIKRSSKSSYFCNLLKICKSENWTSEIRRHHLFKYCLTLDANQGCFSLLILNRQHNLRWKLSIVKTRWYEYTCKGLLLESLWRI